MKTYLVGYDLIKRKDYPELINELEKYPYWHCLDSTWFIRSAETAVEIRNKLNNHIDADDRLIVCLVQSEAAWTASFSEECRQWLTDHL